MKIIASDLIWKRGATRGLAAEIFCRMREDAMIRVLPDEDLMLAQHGACGLTRADRRYRCCGGSCRRSGGVHFWQALRRLRTSGKAPGWQRKI